ncbi:MAG: Long-chain-fatty-acid--CoA ligase [Solirubrobacterales bacterium]|nr:Long-chain-fatty-acid--CoA ligase [Solirubrobacterales bacterium]
MITVGLIGLALAAGTFYVGYEAAYTVPGRGYYNLHAELADAQNMANHYEIREGGVRIGQVLNPRVKNGRALLDLRIDDQWKPLRSDTRLQIRLRSAVGVRYLEVIPGTHGAPLPDGATLPASQAVTPVALDQALGILDARTRARTRQLLSELGKGTAGRGTDLNESIHSAPGFLSSLSSVSQAITGRSGAMSRFVGAADGAAQTFDPVRDTIATGFAPEQRALAPFSDRRTDVQATLTQAAPTLSSLRTTLPAVNGLLAEVDHAAVAARPTLAEAPAALRSTTALLDNAAKPLGDTKKTLELASNAVSPTLSLLDTVQTSLPMLERTFGDVIPTLDYLAPRACDMTQFATGWAEYLKWGDSFNNFIRFLVAAARPDQPAMQSQKVHPLANFVNSNPYPAPCKDGVGVTGWAQPTEQESQRGLVYSKSNLPGSG